MRYDLCVERLGLHGMQGRLNALGTFAVWLSLMAGGAVAGELQVRLSGSDGSPVPFAVLSVPGAQAAQPVSQAGATVDQRERRFDPLVTTITPGTEVTFPNSDDTRHHVYSFSPGNAFELKLFRANDAPPVAFNTPGVVTLGLFVLGRLWGSLHQYAEVAGGEALKVVMPVAGVLLPDLTLGRADLEIAYLIPLKGAYVAYALGYDLCYAGAALLLACLLFSRRDFV